MSNSVLEKMRDTSRLRRIRQGQDAPEWGHIPTMPEIRVALVPLLEKEIQASLIAAAAVDAPDNALGMQYRARVAQQWDLWQAIRLIEDPDKKVYASVDEMIEILEPEDIDSLYDQLTVLMDYASPSLEGLSKEDINELKNAFVLIDWKELSGRRWSALRVCLSHLLPELLLARQPSTTSTPSLTTRNENDTSI